MSTTIGSSDPSPLQKVQRNDLSMTKYKDIWNLRLFIQIGIMGDVCGTPN